MGKSEATQLGDWIHSSGITDRRRVSIFPSAFKRTLDTAAAVSRAIPQSKVMVRPDLFEVGGVYTAGSDGRRSGPGKCLSAAEIAASFEGYDTSALPERGPWYVSGWESDAMGRARASRVAAWIRSPEFRKVVGPDGLAVLVMHASRGHAPPPLPAPPHSARA